MQVDPRCHDLHAFFCVVYFDQLLRRLLTRFLLIRTTSSRTMSSYSPTSASVGLGRKTDIPKFISVVCRIPFSSFPGVVVTIMCRNVLPRVLIGVSATYLCQCVVCCLEYKACMDTAPDRCVSVWMVSVVLVSSTAVSCSDFHGLGCGYSTVARISHNLTSYLNFQAPTWIFFLDALLPLARSSPMGFGI